MHFTNPNLLLMEEDQITGALVDARRYFPGLLNSFYAPDGLAPSTDKQIVLAFAQMLSEWTPELLSQRLVHHDFDKAYYSIPEQAAYVNACERMIDRVRCYTEGHYPQPDLFPNTPHSPEEVWRDVRSAVWHFREWIRWRRYTPIEQLVSMVTTVRIHKEIMEFPGEYTVPIKGVGMDELWFKALLRTFKQAVIHAAPHELTIPFDTLRELKELDLSKVIRAEELYDQQRYRLESLLTDYPMLHLKGLEEEHTISEQVAESFWTNLLHELVSRITWAWESYNVLAIKLEKPQAENPFRIEQNARIWVRTGSLKQDPIKGSSPTEAISISVPELELRHVAMLCYYNGHEITDNNASKIAADNGYTAKTSGQRLKVRWDNNASPEAINMTRSKREANHLIKTIERIISKLDLEQVGKANRDIETIRKNATKDD